jgi:polyphosphate kinase
MPRNFFRRVEIVFPVEDPALRQRVVEDMLSVQLNDTEQARELGPEGAYRPVQRAQGQPALNAQEQFAADALQRLPRESGEG